MKKLVAIFCLFVLFSGMMLFETDSTAHAEESENDYENASSVVAMFIGTWKRDVWWGEARIIVFREDGTMLRGSLGNLTEGTWWIEGGVARTSPFRLYRYIPENGYLTVYESGYSWRARTFTFYSDATDLYEAIPMGDDWTFWAVLLILGTVGIAWVIYTIRKKQAKRKQNKPEVTL